MTLEYADDIVILAGSQIDVLRKLKASEEYCVSIKLKINPKKIKIKH